MACHAIHSWTLIGLVGSFLDLAIAYLLLCAATLAFFASKFLGFFGLCLPCPCNGIFGNSNRNNCLQRLLVDCSTEKVSTIQLSVKSNFPFDSIWARDRNYRLNLKLIRDGNYCVDGFVELEEDGSCSSISGSRKLEYVAQNGLVRRNESGTGISEVNSPLQVKEGRFDLKGKGITNHRQRSSLRRRRRGISDQGKVSSVSSYDPSRDGAQSPYNINRKGCEEVKHSSVAVESGVDAYQFQYDDDELADKNMGGRALQGFGQIECLDGNTPPKKSASSSEEIKSFAQKELDADGNEKNKIRMLEQALEEEHAARAALYFELEKERSAAATAADEAMAMIMRLQEEKASIEMEARQYERIIEEKSAYDAEEMNILKEIIVRREREKHFLEKEVEAYRQMNSDGNQQLQDDILSIVNAQREQFSSSLDLGEDPILMLQQISESIDKREIVKESPENEASSFVKQNCTIASGQNFPTSGSNEAVVLKQGDPNNNKQISLVSGSSQENFISEKTILLLGEQRENDCANLHNGIPIKTIEAHYVTEIDTSYGATHLEQHGKVAYSGSKDHGNMILDIEPHVHDVHVIDGESSLFNEVSGSKCQCLSENDISHVQRIDNMPGRESEIERISDRPSPRGMDTEEDINRSSSDVPTSLPPLGGSLVRRSKIPHLQTNSMSAVDDEMSKIDFEIGWLRERLKIVQEGRQKLNFPVERLERENSQLQILEDLACQIREFRQLTQPGRAVRQSSLPLPSSKDLSKKRRRRSASLGVQKSF